MSTLTACEFINDVYHTMNIHIALFIYDDESYENMKELEVSLQNQDISVFYVDLSCNMTSISHNRTFVCHIGFLPSFEHFCDLESISVVFCLTNHIFSVAKPYFQNAGKTVLIKIL